MSTQTDTSDPNYDFYLSVIDDPIFWLVLAVTGFILGTVIIIANSFLLFTIYKDPRKSLRSPPSFLIASLTASDLLVGLFSVFLVALRDVYRYKGKHMPFVRVFTAVVHTVSITTFFVSIYSIIAMSITCYVAINKPMDYKNIITKRRIKIFIAVLWVISISTCFLPATNVSKKTYTMVYLHTHSSLPVILLPIIYVKVFRALARRKRELQLNGNGFLANSAHVLERERKMTMTIIILLAMFYISYMPQYIMVHVQFFCTSCRQSVTSYKFAVVSSRVWYTNSAINPFVYAWRVPKYRQAFIDCWKMFRGKFRVIPYEIPLSSQTQTGRERHGNFLQSAGQIRERNEVISVHTTLKDAFDTHL